MKYNTINHNRKYIHKPRKASTQDGLSPPWLRRLASFLVFSATIVAASWFFGWNDTFRQTILCGVIGICVSVSWLLSRIMNDQRDSLVTDSILVSIRRSFLLAVTAIALSFILMLAADYFPTHDRYLDRDRSEVERQITLLASANNHQAATELINERLSEPISDTWRQSLQELHVEILSQAGRLATDPHFLQSLCEETISVGKQYGIPTEESRLRLINLLDNQKHSQDFDRLTQELDKEKKQAKLSLEQQQESWVQQLAAMEHHAGLDALLTLQLNTQPQERDKLLRERQLENLIAWGERTDDLDQRGDKYAAAVAYAQQHGLDFRLVESRLMETRRQQQQRPGILPAGTRAFITRHILASSGTQQFHIAVEDAALQFVGGLKKKDYGLFQGEHTITEFNIDEFQSHTKQSTSVLLLLDESPSTQLVKDEVSEAISTLVENSPSHMEFCVLAFADKIHAHTDWTRDIDEIKGILQTNKNGESTALRGSIVAAVKHLRSRPRPRILTIFTDGADNTGQGPDDQQLVNICQTAEIQVFCIGLQSSDLDERLLKRLAKTTNGVYLKTQHAHELSGLFRNLQSEFSQQFYELRIPSSPLHNEPWQLRIGRGDSALELLLDIGLSEDK